MSKTYRKHPKYLKQPQLSSRQAKRRKLWEHSPQAQPPEFPQREPERWKPLGWQMAQDQMLETGLSAGHKKVSVTALELAVQLVA